MISPLDSIVNDGKRPVASVRYLDIWCHLLAFMTAALDPPPPSGFALNLTLHVQYRTMYVSPTFLNLRANS